MWNKFVGIVPNESNCALTSAALPAWACRPMQHKRMLGPEARQQAAAPDQEALIQTITQRVMEALAAQK